ncbi:MAG TPA: hypothetical protein VFO05_12965 [Candidatus Limnocylindrales bacterium]|nr:hypothetical protein [Candidatus Limnocylindrales bacterium]
MIEERDSGRPASGPVRFEASVGRTSWNPAVVVGVIGLFVAVALLKPWEGPSEPGRASATASEPPRAAAVAPPRDRAPGPSRPGASAVAVQAMCLNAFSWRTATIERWDDQTVRVWRALDMRSATGPTDPDIDSAPAVGETVPAIGYCAPASGPDSPVGPAEVVAWRLDGDTATPVELRQVAPVGVVSEFGALFGPPDRGSSWPDGTYVFRHAAIGVGAERWFAVEVRTRTPVRARVDAPAPLPAIEPGDGRAAFFTP